MTNSPLTLPACLKASQTYLLQQVAVISGSRGDSGEKARRESQENAWARDLEGEGLRGVCALRGLPR